MSECTVCHVGPCGYKCPQCFAKYCSVECCQTHKKHCTTVRQVSSTSAAAIQFQQPEEQPQQAFATSDTVASDKLHLLAQSKELSQMLTQESRIRSMLIEINDAENPSELLRKSMQDKDFDKFATTCLNIVEPIEQSPVVVQDQFSNQDVVKTLHDLLSHQLKNK